MSGPGEYVPDVTEGITRVEDLVTKFKNSGGRYQSFWLLDDHQSLLQN